MPAIYLVDSDPHICKTVKLMLETEEWDIRTFGTSGEFFHHFGKVLPDIVITDYRLPEMTGLDLLKRINQRAPEIEVIFTTDVGDQDIAISAMSAGAYDYIKKPVDIKELRLIIDRALQSKKIGDKLSYLYNQQRKMFGFGELIGRSSKMKQVFKIIRMVSESKDTPVVIVGETGTGKELVARSIHANSSRSQEPFVEVNCAAIQESLLESELFGYEQGAFTDARKTKRGLMEVADGGAFFLDEIASMDLALQVKLLKAIEEKKIRRVGGIRDIPIDIRVIASTSIPLENLIEQGKFREDLYYRLNVLTIELPPLRKRGEDILLLAKQFIEKFNIEFNYDISGLSDQAAETLIRHNWPGNVRELRNVIERAVLLKKYGEIDSHHLFLIPNSTNTSDVGEAGAGNVHIPDEGIDLDKIEKEYIKAALDKANGNKSRAARLLGMSRGAFRYRCLKLEGADSKNSD
ncbi:MAG TPA: sigma-54 dependent transcriptional regulator [bacterium]|nr:sigma-54 dependent transcriptional regulator [bacterium]